jgi:hypothetical protein
MNNKFFQIVHGNKLQPPQHGQLQVEQEEDVPPLIPLEPDHILEDQQDPMEAIINADEQHN